MDKNNIFTEAIYGFRSARRSILFRILVILAIVGIVIYQFTPLSGGKISSLNDLFRFSVDWVSQALPSSIAYKTAYFFNIIQLFLVVGFVANDLRAVKFNGMEPLHVRSLNNEEIVFGGFLGKLLLFTLVNFFVFAISILINVAFYPRSFNLSLYLFYWVTLNLPTLVFFLGISYLVTRIVRQQALVMVILLVVLGTLVYWGAGWINGLFDPCARYVPNMFSDFTGHVGMGSYLLQRGFILFMGLGCLVLSVIPYPRIPNRLYAFKRNLSIACVSFLVAGSLALVYMHRLGAIGTNRDVYKRVYAEHGKLPAARMERNDLHVKDLGRGGVSVTSQMTFVNNTTTTIPLVFYLNPGLEVLSLVIDGHGVDFQRECQAVLPGKELQPGERVEVSMNYKGRIDNDICFLDTDSESYNSAAVNNFGIYRFGYAPAFCEKEYKLLTPECIWYPVSVPPYGVSGIRDVNFTRYSLRVEHDPRLSAISQGNTVEKKEGETIFTLRHDMPGISLCLGNYEKREITVDSTRMTLYCSLGHEYLLENYNLPEEKLIEELTYAKGNTFEMGGCIRTPKFKMRYYSGEKFYDPTQQYPYRWITLVEVPCNFYSFPGIMQLTGERVQGGMVFVPEKGFSVNGYSGMIAQKSPEEEGIDMKNMVSAVLGNEISKFLEGGSCDIKPQFLGKTAFIASAEYPLMHDILAQVALGQFNFAPEAFPDGTNAAYPAVEYLKQHSLKEALYDKTLTPEILESIIRRKSEELYTYIKFQVGEKEFQQFYVDFLAGHLFEEARLDEFFQQFHQSFGFPLDSLVKSWYTADRLPLIETRDAHVIKVKQADGSEYGLYDFKVFNRSDVPGVVMTGEEKMWNIPPREGREIRIRSKVNIANAPYDYFYLEIPFAQNLPSKMILKIIEMEKRNPDTTPGVFCVDSSLFLPNTDEIIVDNEDPGCRIVKGKDNFITSLFRKEKSDERYRKYLFKDAWTPTIGERFYGFPIQSALYKGPGTGKQKVEWNAVLPQKGKYEVFFYYAELFTSGYGQKVTLQERYYTVSDGKNEYAVTIIPSEHEQGSWVSLGVFDFSKDAKVTLSDRALETESGLVGFIADAVKWVKVK